MGKPALFVLLLAAVLGAFLWLGPQNADLAGLRDRVGDLLALRAANPGWFVAGYVLAYVAVTAFSLPIAVWMTLGAGAIFGFWLGLAVALGAATVGATLAFLAARYFLRDWVRQRLGERLGRIETGIRRDGAYYLFSLRLIPAIPFFAINLAMGLTGMNWLVFALVSLVGMLAGTAVFVNAGTQLAGLQSLDGILSRDVILSLVLLGLFPWIARAIAGLFRRQPGSNRWRKPARFDRNLIVIGAGAAGLVSSYVAAATGARVTLVEGGRMGGDCLNTGCVPSKALIRAARLANEMRQADRFGLPPTDPDISLGQVAARIAQVVAAIEPHDSADRYRALGVDVRHGHARLIDPWTVEITGADGTTTRLTTRAIILTTGAEPAVPPIPGLEDVGYLTSETLWGELAASSGPPGRWVFLGGGAIGAELAQAFARLGAEVTVIEQADRLLAREDEDLSQAARDALEGDGVAVWTGHRAIACHKDDQATWIETEKDGERHRLTFDRLVVAVGRKARLAGYGLEDLAIPAGRVIETDDYLQTLHPSIYAAGDVAGSLQFTHVAAHQAWYATVNALFGFVRRFRVDYRVIPRAVFLDPEIARVGLSETEARAQGIAFEVTRYGLDDLDRAIVEGAAKGFVKVLTPPGKDRILGAAVVGDHAGDLIAELVLAMKHGIGLSKILSTTHSYPTWSEANRLAAGEWRKAHIRPGLVRWLERLHGWRRGR